MICLAAAFGVLGIAAMGRAHRHCHPHSAFGRGPLGDGDFGRPRRRARWILRALFRKLDATPAQERAIIAETEKLSERVHAAKASVHEARGDLAAALRGPVLDDAALGAVLGRIDAAVGEARAATIEAVRGVHGVLDDAQRTRLAEMIEYRGGWWPRSGRRSAPGTPV
jgi:uncharacterized membrane protein